MKTVSVVMATYNGEKYLREQLDSIINQTYPIHEIIIQDDCSIDGTIAIIEEYAREYSNIMFFVNDNNLGINQNFKTAVMRATGDFIALSDQDDIWFPDKIEEEMKAIGSHSVCCSYYLFGPTLDTAPVVKYEIGAERVLFRSILGHTMLCTREFIQKENSWIKNIWYDWGLAVNAYLEDGVAIVQKALNWHRHHEQEFSYLKNVIGTKPYLPYLYGYKCFRERQKQPNWFFIYSYIHNHTSTEKLPLVYTLSGLLLKKDFWSFLKLCYTCLKYRDKIYPKKEIGKGIMQYVRGFCYPLFWCYSNKHYFKEFN